MLASKPSKTASVVGQRGDLAAQTRISDDEPAARRPRRGDQGGRGQRSHRSALVAEFAGIEGERVAVLDSAVASGLPLIEPQLRDAIGARTTGTGEPIAAAIGAGAASVVVAAGGSATTDGGHGAIQAIGDAGSLRGAKLTVLCDVQTAFEDAAEIFAPQKGAGPEDVVFLSERLG